MKKYVVFSGRARRTEIWMFVLINTIFSVLLLVLDNVLGTTTEDKRSGLFTGLFALATMLPNLAVNVRRLHDVGKSGWWMFIVLIPIIGAIWLFVLTVTDSQADDNEYGANPKLLA